MFKKLLHLFSYKAECAFLENAIEHNSNNIAFFLIKKLRPRISTWLSRTTLPFKIVRDGDLFKVRLLIQLKLNLNLQNNIKRTLYTIAQEYGYDEIAYLLENHEQNCSTIKRKCLVA